MFTKTEIDSINIRRDARMPLLADYLENEAQHIRENLQLLKQKGIILLPARLDLSKILSAVRLVDYGQNIPCNL